MKLYLSSYRVPVPGDLAKLIGKPLLKARMALIPNAKDYYSARARDVKIHESAEYFTGLGFEVEVVDLLQYKDETALQDALKGHDMIWAIGGNTYTLRYAMRHSGFDKIITQLLQDGAVYGGESAGALVAGPSIEGAEKADDPTFAEETIQEGLSLVPYVIVPHADNPQFSGLAVAFHEIHEGEYPIIELKDAEAIVVSGEQRHIASAAAPGLRDFKYIKRNSIVGDVLERFNLEISGSVSLLRFEVFSPDSFMWRMVIGEHVYYLYAEDYIPSLEHVRKTFTRYLGGIEWEFIEPRDPVVFEDAGPVRQAVVYQPEGNPEEFMRYAIDSGRDLVFMVRTNESPIEAYFADLSRRSDT